LQKGHKRGRVLKRIERKGGGFGQFCPFFFLLPTETGEGRMGGGGARGRRPWGLGGAREEGENREGGAGLWWPRAA